ncbi:hypothetical protein Trco_007089 [Trichoderma cornu-damae]|uniref:Uncharacterized protein n=1 Tax=Trichoderma cornu-damae TaxID=654480 RepID=A0A9P8QN32_9HYPO|nr:hypothetical protein Trco_007089 [Trichoderma cornu-damae]
MAPASPSHLISVLEPMVAQIFVFSAALWSSLDFFLAILGSLVLILFSFFCLDYRVEHRGPVHL